MQESVNTHSAFIDSLAQTSLIISLVAVPMTLLLMFVPSGPNVDIQEVLALSGIDIEPPNSVVFIFKHLKAISLSLLAVSIFSAVSSYALLKRRNWARLAFIAMLALNIIANIIGVIYSLASPAIRLSAKGLPVEAQAQIVWIVRAATGINAVLIIGLSIAMAWMVKRLMSDAIRREFVPPLR